MEWGAEQIALAIAGALFLAWIVASLHPRLALSLSTRIVLSVAAGVYFSAALAAGGSAPHRLVPVVWFVSCAVAVAATRELWVRHSLRSARAAWSRGRGLGARRSTALALSHPVPPAPQDQHAVPVPTPALDPAASSADLEDLAFTFPEARPAVAAHAATPASLLSWLALHGDSAVVEAIASRQESAEVRREDR